jgi:hypothetical protein
MPKSRFERAGNTPERIPVTKKPNYLLQGLKPSSDNHFATWSQPAPRASSSMRFHRSFETGITDSLDNLTNSQPAKMGAARIVAKET